MPVPSTTATGAVKTEKKFDMVAQISGLAERLGKIKPNGKARVTAKTIPTTAPKAFVHAHYEPNFITAHTDKAIKGLSRFYNKAERATQQEAEKPVIPTGKEIDRLVKRLYVLTNASKGMSQ